jgi:hypothetical protein
MDKLTLIAIPAPTPEDALTFRESDSFARKIFVTYTTHIPWIADRSAAISRSDEACYAFSPKAKA